VRRPLPFLLTHVLPTMALLLVVVWPLVQGSKTLYLRDAANTHLPAKWAQAEAMREGRLPLIDPLRDGGQPALGNPNTAAGGRLAASAGQFDRRPLWFAGLVAAAAAVVVLLLAAPRRRSLGW